MKKIIVTLAALVSIGGAMAFNQYSQAQMERKAPPKTQPANPLVTVAELRAGEYRASLKAYGEVKATESLNLTAQISGKVNYISPKLRSGAQFAQGEVLIGLEDIDYRYQVTNAESSLADAELAYLQEVKNGEQALEEWQASGLALAKASDLVLRKPQLKVAETKLALAKLALAKAKSDLAKSKIRAPFDAIIISKAVSLGSFLQPGTQVASMYNANHFEIPLPLTYEQWQQLPDEQALKAKAWPVTLSLEGKALPANAQIGRFEKHLSSDSRQRSLIVKVNQPLASAEPIFPGDFVSVDFSGVTLANLWQVPDSALTKDISLWLLDSNNSLKKVKVELAFARGGHSYVRLPAEITQAKVVVRPLASYMAGMLVTPAKTEVRL